MIDFNSAWEEYKKPSERRGDGSREETSHNVAWNELKKVIRKILKGIG
jgi:cation transport regulator